MHNCLTYNFSFCSVYVNSFELKSLQLLGLRIPGRIFHYTSIISNYFGKDMIKNVLEKNFVLHCSALPLVWQPLAKELNKIHFQKNLGVVE